MSRLPIASIALLTLLAASAAAFAQTSSPLRAG